MPRQKLKEGDVFEISLENGETAYGQILSIEPDALNSIGCVFWEPSVNLFTVVTESNPLSVLLISPDLLKKGAWRIIGNAMPKVQISERPYEAFRKNNWVGVKVIGSGIIVELMRACAGLREWNKWAIPEYLDQLLLPGIVRPERAVLESCS